MAAPARTIRAAPHGRGWRWGLHAAIAALAVSPLLASLAWGLPLSVAPAAYEWSPRYVEAWTDGGRAGLPPLGALAEDQRPLAARITQYRVVPGDTLHDVARRFGVSVDTLLWANALPDADRLLANQELTILPVSGVLHTAAEGDSVAALAERYGTRAVALIAANGLEEPYALRGGDRLLVPDGRPLRTTAGGTVASAAPWPAPGTGVRLRQQFIEAAAVPAQESQRRSGVPASVAIAQAIHETGWGGSRLATEGFNFFGIKGRNSAGPAGVVWFNTWEVFNGRNVIVREPFRAYHSPEESFMDHGTFLLANRRYQQAMAVTHDSQAFTREMAKAGFATDPVYAGKIIRMMDQYNLYQYDLR